MRQFTIIGIGLALLVVSASGCCRHRYGMCGPYGGCVDCNDGFYPGPSRMNHYERKQARELRRWYRDLNGPAGNGHGPQGMGMGGCGCEFCQGGCMMDGCSMGDCGPGGCGDGMAMDGMPMEGMVMDGQMMGASGFCPSCQQNMQNAMPSAPMLEPSPTPKTSAPVHGTSGEYFSPPSAAMPLPMETAGQGVQQMQMLYVPQSFQQ
jgi:hypothetical protein